MSSRTRTRNKEQFHPTDPGTTMPRARKPYGSPPKRPQRRRRHPGGSPSGSTVFTKRPREAKMAPPSPGQPADKAGVRVAAAHSPEALPERPMVGGATRPPGKPPDRGKEAAGEEDGDTNMAPSSPDQPAGEAELDMSPSNSPATTQECKPPSNATRTSGGPPKQVYCAAAEEDSPNAPQVDPARPAEHVTDQVHPSGMSFVLSDGAGKNTTVELSEPLEEELSGIVEVVGKVTQKATVLSISFVPFREDINSFDLGLYDEALKVIHDFPQYYPFGQKGLE